MRVAAIVATLLVVLSVGGTSRASDQFYNWGDFARWCYGTGGRPVPNPPRCYHDQLAPAPTKPPTPPPVTPDPNLQDAPNDIPVTAAPATAQPPPQPPPEPQPTAVEPPGPPPPEPGDLDPSEACVNQLGAMVPMTMWKLAQPHPERRNYDNNAAIRAKMERNTQAWLPIILRELNHAGVTDASQVAFVLATVNLETARFTSLDELNTNGGSKTAEELKARTPDSDDGLTYRGMGFVQITGRENYAAISRHLQNLGYDVDLVAHPERAKDPDLAAVILVKGLKNGWFTGRGTLQSYIPASGTEGDIVGSVESKWYAGRALVNGDKNKDANGSGRRPPPGSTHRTFGMMVVNFANVFEPELNESCYVK